MKKYLQAAWNHAPLGVISIGLFILESAILLAVPQIVDPISEFIGTAVTIAYLLAPFLGVLGVSIGGLGVVFSIYTFLKKDKWAWIEIGLGALGLILNYVYVKNFLLHP